MKNLLQAILLIALVSLNIFGQCETEPTITTTGKILKELKIKKNASRIAEAEIGLSIKASAAGSSWQTKGAEAAVLTVFVDGKYNQDAVLFAGEQVFEYQMLLGKHGAGEHQITIVFNEARSAPNARNVKIQTAFATAFEDLIANAKQTKSSIPAYIATLNAPVIYLRPDTIDKFSDVPLLTFYEITDEPQNVKRIRYTTVFTNEDGGTQSAALMARWGRMTDIEWVYEIRVGAGGEILSAIYQAANHETKSFDGRKLGSHPLIFNRTVNNNFSVDGCSALRVSPLLIQTNLSNGSRETVMDAFPWTYRIMAEEAIREGRVNPEKIDSNTIADPRDYVYAEIYSEPENAAIALEAAMPDGKTISSDANNKSLRVNRNGFVRIALRLPPEFSKSSPPALSIRCYAADAGGEGLCRNVDLVKIVRLNRNYFPREVKIDAPPQTITTGESAKFLMTPTQEKPIKRRLIKVK